MPPSEKQLRRVLFRVVFVVVGQLEPPGIQSIRCSLIIICTRFTQKRSSAQHKCERIPGVVAWTRARLHSVNTDGRAMCNAKCMHAEFRAVWGGRLTQYVRWLAGVRERWGHNVQLAERFNYYCCVFDCTRLHQAHVGAVIFNEVCGHIHWKD